MPRLSGRALGIGVAVLVLASCTSAPARPSSAVSPGTSTAATPSAPAPSPTATQSMAAPTPTLSPTPAPTLAPGELCDPADGSPDCTDATGEVEGPFRYIVGYADCVEDFGPEHAYGLCTDLDGDGYAGYPDSH